MTERERMLAVYRGETPDQVPFFLDLSHWFYQRNRIPFDLSKALREPDWPLIEYHKKIGAGFYIPNLISYFDVEFAEDVRTATTKETTPARTQITWRIETPLGCIERRRQWEEQSYSWGISHWGVETARDLRVLGYALSRMRFVGRFERYLAWKNACGDLGVLYMPLGYSAMGHLLNYWMGIERTMYAAADMPGLLHEVVDSVNQNLLACLDVLCQSPAEVIILGDNFSSSVQPPRFFREWSAGFYAEAFRRISAAGKSSAVHVDGLLKGLLGEFSRLGCDAIDAVTPAPMGDLTPRQCREEAGPRMILSGGVPPTAWLEETSDIEFDRAAVEWLETGALSPALIAAAGDQVPPGAPERRIERMRELVEKYGAY